MAKQICMITKHSMKPMQYAEIMPYHINIMCLLAHNKPKNAHTLELFCTEFQYNPSSFTLFRQT